MTEDAVKTDKKGRKYKSAKNFLWGITSQILFSAIHFIIRTVIVKNMGLEYVSLNGLFTEIISMLTLSELGIGTAITYSLYKPLADGDQTKIRQYMTMYKKAYRVIAAAILGIGLALMPFIPLLVSDIGFPENYIRLVFMLFVVKTAGSYMYSFKSGIISADQRMYLVTFIQSTFNIASLLVSLAVLLVTKEFVAYLAVQIVFTFAGNFAISRRADKEYPYIKQPLELPKEDRRTLLKNIRSIFIGRLSGKITNSTDNILITLLVSTLSVGLYSNYAMILGVMTSLLTQFQASISASFGNMFATDSDYRCERALCYLTYIMAGVGCVCAAGFYCVMTPLVTLWLGEGFLLPISVLFVLSVNLFFMTAHAPLWVSMSASGLFKYDKNSSIAGSAVNLVVSVILGKSLGMLGIFIGTSFTHIIQIVWKIVVIYKLRFKSSYVKSLITWLWYACLAVASMLLSSLACDAINPGISVWGLLARAVIACAVTGAILLATSFRSEYFKRALGDVRSTVKKTLSRTRAV